MTKQISISEDKEPCCNHVIAYWDNEIEATLIKKDRDISYYDEDDLDRFNYCPMCGVQLRPTSSSPASE